MAGSAPLTREDVLLLIAAGASGRYPLDPIRLMKGAFLVSQRGRSEWKALFQFEPYDYGPFDKSVYASRDFLLSRGYLIASNNGRYDSYTLSDLGLERVRELEEQIGSEDAAWFKQIGEYVTSVSFATLLRQIYANFPDFAARSVARV